MDNAGGPSRSDQLDLMLTYEQQAHARTKAERDSLRNKLTAMTAARNIEEDRVNEADGQLAVLNAEMVALHTQLGAEDEESVLDAVLRLQRSREDDTVLLGTVAAERDAALQRAEAAERGIHIQAAAVRVIDQKERAEYVATQTLDSEREMNATLTAEVERLTQRAEQAEAALAQAQATLQDVRDDLASDEALGCEPDLSDYVARLSATLEATR